jgi:hypothetical protein
MSEPNDTRGDSWPEFLSEAEVHRIELTPEQNMAGKEPWTAKRLLDYMKRRQKYLGSPLSEGFVPPPGIDIEELLKQLPPPPPTT